MPEKPSSNQKGNSNTDNRPDIGMIKSFIETQKQKAANESQELKLEEKRLEYNYKLANKNMDIQKALIEKDPGERRKNIVLVSLIGFLVIGGLCVFIWVLIQSGNESFAHQIVKWGSYLLIAVVSYFAGKKSRSSEKDDSDDIEDAEIIP